MREKAKAEKSEKAASQASRAAARRTQRLEQALKTSRKGKRTSLKATADVAIRKRIATKRQGGGKAPGVAASPSPAQSRHGRRIKLQAKFR